VKSKEWYLYVVECSDGTFYTGVTTDIPRRVNEHNTSARGAKYTRSRRPVRTVYWRKMEDKSSAQTEESKFKRLSRKQKQEIISSHLLEKIGEHR